MQLRRMPAKSPNGLSFAIPDLLLLKGWSEFHNLHMVVDLDVCRGNDEYEELLALYDLTTNVRRWMLWRSHEGVVVQPATGGILVFNSMADALEILIPVSN